MKLRWAPAIILLVLLYSSSCWARLAIFDHPLTPVSEKKLIALEKDLAKRPWIKGAFKQTRKVQGLEKSFVTQGDFLFVREKGVYWNIVSPFKATYVFTEKGNAQIVDGKKNVIDARERPYYEQISNMIKTLSSGEVMSLREFYDLFFQGAPEKWQVGLVAREDMLKKATAEMTISGDQYIRKIAFRDENDNSTSIVFTKLQTLKKLISREKDYFAL
jgi:hypothetical protein